MNSKESEELILNINKIVILKKQYFVYDINRKFIGKYDGVTEAQKALNISHSTIKKYAKLDAYKVIIYLVMKD